MVGSEDQRFERFYYAHFNRVASYVLSRTDRDTAQDVLARTFEIAWRRFAEVPDEPLPWLLGVARRVLSGQRRSDRRRDALAHRVASTVASATPDQAETVARRQLAAEALASLSSAQREAMLLIAWDGLSQEEAAVVVGCSRVAFAVRVHRARSRLRTALAEITALAENSHRSPPNAARREPAADAPTSKVIEDPT